MVMKGKGGAPYVGGMASALAPLPELVSEVFTRALHSRHEQKRRNLHHERDCRPV